MTTATPAEIAAELLADIAARVELLQRYPRDLSAYTDDLRRVRSTMIEIDLHAPALDT